MIYLLFAVLPTSVQLVRPEEPLSVSKSVVLVCKSLGSRPPATITWWKKGKFMGKAPEEVSMFTFVQTYIFDEVDTIDITKIDVLCKFFTNFYFMNLIWKTGIKTWSKIAMSTMYISTAFKRV